MAASHEGGDVGGRLRWEAGGEPAGGRDVDVVDLVRAGAGLSISKGLYNAGVEAAEDFGHGRCMCLGALLQLCPPVTSILRAEQGRSLRQKLHV